MSLAVLEYVLKLRDMTELAGPPAGRPAPILRPEKGIYSMLTNTGWRIAPNVG